VKEKMMMDTTAKWMEPQRTPADDVADAVKDQAQQIELLEIKLEACRRELEGCDRLNSWLLDQNDRYDDDLWECRKKLRKQAADARDAIEFAAKKAKDAVDYRKRMEQFERELRECQKMIPPFGKAVVNDAMGDLKTELATLRVKVNEALKQLHEIRRNARRDGVIDRMVAPIQDVLDDDSGSAILNKAIEHRVVEVLRAVRESIASDGKMSHGKWTDTELGLFAECLMALDEQLNSAWQSGWDDAMMQSQGRDDE